MAKPTKEELAVIDENSKNLLDSKEVKELKTVQDIIARFSTGGAKVYDVGEVIPDFGLVDSSELVGVPFTVAHFEPRYSEQFGRFRPEDGLFEKGLYYSVFVITDDGKRLVFNDGGTGIVPVAENFIETTHQTGGMRCPWGLRASSYEKVLDNGQKVQATTYYFATSKPKTT